MHDKTFISLYSGCGGMDLGFAKAGFRPVWANDIDVDAVETYNRLSKIGKTLSGWTLRHAEGHQAVCADIRIVAQRLEGKSADLVIGGPPCQGFSVAGRMDPTDARWSTVFDFLAVVAMVKPKAFVMENVKALARNRRWLDVITQLKEKAGRDYDVELVVLNAAHSGHSAAPASACSLLGLPKSAGGLQLPEPPTVDQPRSVRSALAKPPLWYARQRFKMHGQNHSREEPRRASFAICGNALGWGQGHAIDLERPAPTLPATMGGNRTPIIDSRQASDGSTPWIVGYHKRVVIDGKPPLTRLPKDAPLRRLTVEEAATIQTFPSDVDWQGRQGSRFRQVGNAVPPLSRGTSTCAVRRALERSDGSAPA